MHDGFLDFLVCVLVYGLCCPLNGGVRYRECPLREAILYYLNYLFSLFFLSSKKILTKVQELITCRLNYLMISITSYWIL